MEPHRRASRVPEHHRPPRLAAGHHRGRQQQRCASACRRESGAAATTRHEPATMTGEQPPNAQPPIRESGETSRTHPDPIAAFAALSPRTDNPWPAATDDKKRWRCPGPPPGPGNGRESRRDPWRNPCCPYPIVVGLRSLLARRWRRSDRRWSRLRPGKGTPQAELVRAVPSWAWSL